jgi:hypothetical protein
VTRPLDHIDLMPLAAAERRAARLAYTPPVEVCPDCDIADCRHIRARRALRADPDPRIIEQLIETGRADL